MNEVRTWTSNGHRYWQIKTKDAELVASMPETYTPYWPPSWAKVEAYAVKKGMSTFLGYLEGAQLTRAVRCFQQAFAK